MNALHRLSLLAFAAAVALVCSACGDDDGGTDAGRVDSGGTDAGDDTDAGGGDGVFVFRTDAPDAYEQVDRSGMPAVSTALISATDKDAYNQASPEADAAGEFVEEIVASLTAIHEALDGDLTMAGLTPCSMTADPNCTTQEVAPGVSVASLIIPDVLRVNPDAPAGFPNGRMLADPIIDVTLAVALLDLTSTDGCGGEACTALTLASVPLNPPENDVPFLDMFPYVGPPHAP